MCIKFCFTSVKTATKQNKTKQKEEEEKKRKVPVFVVAESTISILIKGQMAFFQCAVHAHHF